MISFKKLLSLPMAAAKFILIWSGCFFALLYAAKHLSFVNWKTPGDTAASLEIRIREAFDSFHAHLKWQGVVVLMKDDRVLIDQAWGHGIDTGQVFPVNSISKSMTAGVILRLQELGRLSIEDPMCKHFKNPCPESWRDITLEQLLSHTSGLDAPQSSEGLSYLLEYMWRRLSSEEILEKARKIERTSEAGTFAYSNLGYQLASLVIENVTGLSFSQAMREYLFTPYGLHETSAIEHETPVRTGYSVWPLSPIGPTLVLSASWYHWTRANSLGAGAVQSTVRDLAAWGRLAMSDSFLRSATRERWLSPRVKQYALGWVEFTDPDEHKWYWHNGGSPGFHSQLFFQPDTRIVLAVLSDIHGINNDIDKAMIELLRLMTRKPYELPVGRKWFPGIR